MLLFPLQHARTRIGPCLPPLFEWVARSYGEQAALSGELCSCRASCGHVALHDRVARSSRATPLQRMAGVAWRLQYARLDIARRSDALGRPRPTPPMARRWILAARCRATRRSSSRLKLCKGAGLVSAPHRVLCSRASCRARLSLAVAAGCTSHAGRYIDAASEMHARASTIEGTETAAVSRKANGTKHGGGVGPGRRGPPRPRLGANQRASVCRCARFQSWAVPASVLLQSTPFKSLGRREQVKQSLAHERTRRQQHATSS